MLAELLKLGLAGLVLSHGLFLGAVSSGNYLVLVVVPLSKSEYLTIWVGTYQQPHVGEARGGELLGLSEALLLLGHLLLGLLVLGVLGGLLPLVLLGGWLVGPPAAARTLGAAKWAA